MTVTPQRLSESHYLSADEIPVGNLAPGKKARRENREVSDSIRLLRVLVVDNDGDTVDSLSSLLRLWGHDVRIATDGSAALQSALDVLPDLVLLDVAMPKISGCEVAQCLRRQARFHQTRIVAVSGYVDAPHQDMCRHSGFDDFLAKPIDMAILEELLMKERARAGSRSEKIKVCRLPPTFERGQTWV